MKRQPTEWEKIFANDMTSQRLLFKIYKQLIQLNIKKQLIKRRLEQTLLQRGHTDGQQAYEKMLNITNHQGNANENPMKYHLTLVRMVIIKKASDNKCCQGCGEKGTLVHCWWECKLVQSLWKTVRRCLKNFEVEYCMIQQFHL